MKKFFEELSRCLREGGVESSNVEDRRLEIFLHGQPVLFVSPGNDVFLFPAGSNNPEASELYHRVAQTADEVYTYVEEVQTAPTLHISGLSEKFHLLADFGGAVLAGRELENGRGYAELRYPTLLSARDERHVQTVLAYRNEVREWSIERLMEAEKNFFTKCGRLPEPYEYTAENGLPMYSVFCRLAKEAFEEIIRAQFLETQELSGPVLTM